MRFQKKAYRVVSIIGIILFVVIAICVCRFIAIPHGERWKPLIEKHRGK